MFKKLWTKFIVMSMVAISIVLFSIIAVINIKNYYVINKNADSEVHPKYWIHNKSVL